MTVFVLGYFAYKYQNIIYLYILICIPVANGLICVVAKKVIMYFIRQENVKEKVCKEKREDHYDNI